MRRLIALALLCVGLLGACGGDDGTSPEPSTEATSTARPTPEVERTIVDIEVADGEVVGGMKRHEVPLGNEVRIQVRSDVADEIHVHGYDEKADIAAGGGVNMRPFIADVPGVFIVELEERGLHIAELEVR